MSNLFRRFVLSLKKLSGSNICNAIGIAMGLVIVYQAARGIDLQWPLLLATALFLFFGNVAKFDIFKISLTGGLVAETKKVIEDADKKLTNFESCQHLLVNYL